MRLLTVANILVHPAMQINVTNDHPFSLMPNVICLFVFFRQSIKHKSSWSSVIFGDSVGKQRWCRVCLLFKRDKACSVLKATKLHGRRGLHISPSSFYPLPVFALVFANYSRLGRFQ
ncbi:hypothetical protein M513_03313 [Trichuris suis]|nr:hypothetical protein M513_03313 [Trichuris suis]